MVANTTREDIARAMQEVAALEAETRARVEHEHPDKLPDYDRMRALINEAIACSERACTRQCVMAERRWKEEGSDLKTEMARLERIVNASLALVEEVVADIRREFMIKTGIVL